MLKSEQEKSTSQIARRFLKVNAFIQITQEHEARGLICVSLSYYFPPGNQFKKYGNNLLIFQTFSFFFSPFLDMANSDYVTSQGKPSLPSNR